MFWWYKASIFLCRLKLFLITGKNFIWTSSLSSRKTDNLSCKLCVPFTTDYDRFSFVCTQRSYLELTVEACIAILIIPDHSYVRVISFYFRIWYYHIVKRTRSHSFGVTELYVIFYVALNSLKHQWKILKKSIKRFQIAIFGSGLLWQHQTSVWLTSLNYGPRRSRDSEALANENKTSHIQCRGRDHSRVCPKTTYEKVKVDFCFTFNCYK